MLRAADSLLKIKEKRQTSRKIQKSLSYKPSESTIDVNNTNTFVKFFPLESSSRTREKCRHFWENVDSSPELIEKMEVGWPGKHACQHKMYTYCCLYYDIFN